MKKKIFIFFIIIIFTGFSLQSAAQQITSQAEDESPDTIFEVSPPAEMSAEAGEPLKGPEQLQAITSKEITGIKLIWQPLKDKKFKYNIYRATSGAGEFIKINKEPVIVSEYIDNSENSITIFNDKTTYYYKVTGIDSTGVETDYSPLVSAKWDGILLPPEKITVIAKSSSILLKWEKPVSSGYYDLDGYNIFRGLSGSERNKINKSIIKVTEFEDNADGAGLTQGVKYIYYIQTVDIKGNTSQLSKKIEAVPFTAIAAPKNLTATPVSSESIKLLWDEPEIHGTYGIKGYNILRSTDPNIFPDKPINEVLVRSLQDEKGRNFYFDNIINSETQPLPGINYYYKIVPVDMQGNTGVACESVSTRIEFTEVKKSGIISYDISEYGLPPDSKLELSGLKTISLTLVNRWYEITIPDRNNVIGEPHIEQPLRVMLKGQIGKKIKIDINYNDEKTDLTGEETKISVSYQGEKDETLQEVSFGDMSFDLPNTRYIRSPQSLFGIKSRVSLLDNKLRIMFGWAQPRGITEKQYFKGTLREKETNNKPGTTLRDTDFIKNQYFYLTRDYTKITGLNPFYIGTQISVVPGSVMIYVDEGTTDAYNPGTIYTTPTGKYRFNIRTLGTDYTVDYRTGIIKFNGYIPSNYVIAVAYRLTNGESVGYTATGAFDFDEANLVSASDGITTNLAHLIKSSQTDISHVVMNYYYMGDTQIYNPMTDTGYFDIKIYKVGSPQILPRPWEKDADKYYEIDADTGILKFKAFYPFTENSTDPRYFGATGTESTNGAGNDAYNIDPAAVRSNFTIELKYRYNVSSYRLDNYPVVAGSEIVRIDGVKQKKDVDYQIIYEAGEIIFLDKSKIRDDSLIEIIYDYSPFIQVFDNSIWGGRTEYQLFENLLLGTTYLNKTSTKPTTIPDARNTDISFSTPYSAYILDSDFKFDLKKENLNYIINSLPLLNNVNLPIDINVNGEIAHSDLNSNIYDIHNEKGVAMIDDMEGADNIRTLTMAKNYWFPAAIPIGMQPEYRSYCYKDDYTGYGHEVVTSQTTVQTQKPILTLSYSGLTDQRGDAFRYIVSSNGESFRNYTYMELWVRVVDGNRPVKMDIDIGVVSEDSNGNNSFSYNGIDSEDTEPVNGRLELDKGEDSGISSGIYPSNPVYWGSGNNILDTEDMNNNGRLDTDEKYYRFSTAATGDGISYPELEIQPNGEWKNIRIPLYKFSSSVNLSYDERLDPALPNSRFMSLIKHIRITVKGSSGSSANGKLEIESIKFIGNAWALKVKPSYDMAGNYITSPDTNKFNIYTINRNTDPSYIPNVDFYDYKTESDKDYEKSLAMEYKLSNYDLSNGQPIYYAVKNFTGSTGYDFRSYKNLKIDLFFKRKVSGITGRVLFVRFISNAADENNDYYQYNELIDDVPSGAWKTIEFKIDGSDKKRSPAVGSPNLRKVIQVVVGIINPTNIIADEEIYLNNIRLINPEPKIGNALFLGSNMNWSGFMNSTYTYEEQETDFNTIDDIGKSQLKSHFTNSIFTANTGLIPVIPMNYRFSRMQAYVEDKYKNDASYTDNFTKSDSDTIEHSGGIGFNAISGLNFNTTSGYYDTRFTYYGIYSYQTNRQEKFIIKPSVTWTAPDSFLFIPIGSNVFNAWMELEDVRKDYYAPYSVTVSASFYDSWKQNIEQYYKWNGSYNFWLFSITPSFEYRFEQERGNLDGSFEYYRYELGYFNYTTKFLVLRYNITPQLNFRINDLWIFSPGINYSSNHNMDYTTSILKTTGRLGFSTAIFLSRILSVIPDISEYSFNIDITENYNRIYDTESFEKFNTLTFERRWNIFLFQMLYDENEMEIFEKLSYNGVINFNHTLRINEVRLGDIFSFTPYGTYTKVRSSSGKSLLDPSETFRLQISNIQIKKITIPGLEFLIKDKTISANYSYSRTLNRNALKLDEIFRDSETHSGDVTLYFGETSVGMVNGNINVRGSNTNSRERSVTTWQNVLSPALNLGYTLKVENPITLWDWLPFVGGKVIKFEQNINLSSTINAEITNGLSTGNIRTSTGRYSFSLGGNYNVLQNIRSKANIIYSYVKDYINNNNTYHELSISASVDIEF